MGYLIGVVLAIVIGFFATLVGLDRDRSFYPTVLIVIALLYALFAAIGGSLQALALESIGIAAFVTAAVVGFKRSMWVVVAGLAMHGLYDFVHARLFVNPGVPPWWPSFCLAYDVVAAAYLAWRMPR